LTNTKIEMMICSWCTDRKSEV